MKTAALFAILAGLLARPLAAQPGTFDHRKHERLFPTCVTCHRGAAAAGQPMFPAPATCATCHDGTVRAAVTWAPKTAPARGNLRFTHATHADSSNASCTECHTAAGAPAMAVERAAIPRCLTCHRVSGEHLAVADAACVTCHVPLAGATTLTREDVAAFPAPPSHRVPGFGGSGHGPLALRSVSSCSVCHARDFCSSCHVNALETRPIQALPSDARSLAIRTELRAPASHRDPAFLDAHGKTARGAPQQCAACHTRESCLTCHAGNPRVASALPAAGAGRAPGARTERVMPPSHGVGFRDRHGAQASSMPTTCSTCHTRPQCMECHRPSTASASREFHAAGFLQRHPAAAYARETSCADCHNPQTFCTSCHVTSGFATRATLGAGYHDAKRSFLLGHGPAARQNLETCVSCHAERDCTSCHASQGGRRFNPHGPGFNAARLREKNPESCTVCHGTAIPR